MPEVGPSTELVDLVSGESWLLLQVAEVNQVYVQIWPADLTVRSFLSFVDFIKGLTCVNDCSERNIRLIQDFVSGFKSEDMKQNLMLVARNNRKKITQLMTKEELKNA